MVVIYTGVHGKSSQAPHGTDTFIAHKLVCETILFLTFVLIVWTQKEFIEKKNKWAETFKRQQHFSGCI